MAADATLAKGAYEATRYRGQGVDAAQKELGDNLNQAVKDIAKDKATQKAQEKEKAKTTPEQEPVLEEVQEVDDGSEDQEVESKEGEEKKEEQTFDEAFAAAREELGPGKTFKFKGKEYTTWYEGEEKKHNEENNNSNAENQIVRGGNPNSADLEVVTAQMEYLKNEWADGDQIIANQGLVKVQEDVAKFNGFLDGVAQGQIDKNIKGGKDGTGFSSAYVEGNADYDWAMEVMNNSQNNIANFSFQDDGDDKSKSLKIKGPEGNYITIDQATTKIQGMMVDVDASNAFNAIFDRNLSKIKEDKSAVLNTAEVDSQINEWMNSSKNVSSILHDNMFKGNNRSWVEDFKEGLTGIPLEGLGINEEDIERFNENSPGVIDAEDNLSEEDIDTLIKIYTAEHTDHAKSTARSYFKGVIVNNHRKMWEAEYPGETYPGDSNPNKTAQEYINEQYS